MIKRNSLGFWFFVLFSFFSVSGQEPELFLAISFLTLKEKN